MDNPKKGVVITFIIHCAARVEVKPCCLLFLSLSFILISSYPFWLFDSFIFFNIASSFLLCHAVAPLNTDSIDYLILTLINICVACSKIVMHYHYHCYCNHSSRVALVKHLRGRLVLFLLIKSSTYALYIDTV